MRHDYDVYTKQIASMKKYLATDAVVFQQKGLSAGANDDHYARIIIQHIPGEQGEFDKSTDAPTLDYDTREILKEQAKESSKPYKLLNEPTCRWITINNFTKAIEVEYRRNAGNNRTTHCTMYYLFNNSEMVITTISYREQEKQLWLPDLDNVIKTFNWKKIK